MWKIRFFILLIVCVASSYASIKNLNDSLKTPEDFQSYEGKPQNVGIERTETTRKGEVHVSFVLKFTLEGHPESFAIGHDFSASQERIGMYLLKSDAVTVRANHGSIALRGQEQVVQITDDAGNEVFVFEDFKRQTQRSMLMTGLAAGISGLTALFIWMWNKKKATKTSTMKANPIPLVRDLSALGNARK